MLFYITDSLIVEKRDNRYPKIRKAIRNLLIGYSESKLMLLADYSVLEWMLNQFEYDEDLISPLKLRMHRRKRRRHGLIRLSLRSWWMHILLPDLIS